MNNLKTDKIIKLITSFAQGNLRDKIKLEGNSDELDVIAQGLNMLGEELEFSKQKLNEKENKIRESEDRYHTLINNSNELIQSVSIEGKFLFVNEAWKKTLGYNPDEIKSMNIFDIIDEESKQHCLKLLQRVANGEGIDNIEVVFKAKNGNKIYAEGNARPRFHLEKIAGTHSFFRNVTDRKGLEDRLKKNEFILSEAQRISKMGSWEADFETNNVIWSSEMYNIYNCDSKSFTPSADSLISLVHPEDREALSKSIANMMSGINQSPLIIRLNTADNNIKYIQGHGEVIFNNAGKPIRAIGTAQDITLLKKTKEALKKSENQIKRYAKHLNDVLEDERAHLAREIHDELGQQLAGIKIELLAFTTTPINDSQIKEKANKMMKEVDDLIQSLRKIATQLRPGILDSLGLIPFH